MIDYLIPKAFAASIGSTAAAGKDAAMEKGNEGIQGLISFVVRNIDNWIAGVFILIFFYILSKMAAKGIKEAIIKKKGEDIQESILILVERMTKITVLTVGVTIAAAINGLNFTAVLGAMSLGIGFALKDIIGNFISGVLMLSQDRIQIGDFIKVNDILGTIVSIDTRATILQAVDGTEVVIPNQTMLNQTLISYSTNPFRRVELIVGVDYKTDLPMVTSLIKGIIDKDKDIVPKPEAVILVDEFGDSSISIKIRFWVESNKDWMSIRSNFANRMKKAFDELGINIPFPITTLKLDENDRSFLKTMKSMQAGYIPGEEKTHDKEEIKAVAEKTANEKTIPEQLFKSQPNIAEVLSTATAPTPMATSTPTPQPTPQVEAIATSIDGTPKPIPQEPKPEVPTTPPPSHL